MSTLNTAQQAAVASKSHKILCLAGAGTGKTHTMLARIQHIVENGADPKSILALTFTNAAAFEMRERYAKVAKTEDTPEFRTFHSFCYSLISNSASVRMSLGYTSVPSIAMPEDLRKIEAYIKAQLHIQKSFNELIKSPLPKDKQLVDVWNKAFYKEMHRRNLITFDTLCYGVGKMFTNNKPYVDQYKRKYKYIFVDEFQDTDPRQWDFVSSFTEADLFIVGDALQAIYRFRGADSEIIKKLSVDPEWEVIKLYENYRSTKQICEYANKNSKYADGNYRIEISSSKEGPDVTIIPCCLRKYQRFDTTAFLNIVDDWKQRKEGTGAILCRTNSEVREVRELLTSSNIPYVSDKNSDEIVNLLKSSVDSQYQLDWLLTFLNMEAYAEYIRIESIVATEDDAVDVKLNRFLTTYGNYRNIAQRAKIIQEIKSIIDQEIDWLSKCQSILRIFEIDMHSIILGDIDSIDSNDVMIERLITAFQDRQQSNLYVGTIHSSKGLEYDTVYLLHANTTVFQLNNEDNQNLFYVGVTRAKNNLIVEYCE